MPEYRGAGRWPDNPTGLSLGDRVNRIALGSAGMCAATITVSAVGVNLGVSIEMSSTPAKCANRQSKDAHGIRSAVVDGETPHSYNPRASFVWAPVF